MGVLLAEDTIGSIDDPVTRYAPALIGSAYDGATIRNVLNMASGVKFDEDYLAFDSDINKIGSGLALGGSMDSFAQGIAGQIGPPGIHWQYVLIDTHVLGIVIRGAAGRSTPDLLSEKMMVPLGLEIEPYYVTDGNGVALVLGGLNMITRDYARFGQLYLNDGRANGRQILPQDWVRASTMPPAPEGVGYGFQWSIPPDAVLGEFMARGAHGQYLYINRLADVVIAMNAANSSFTEPGVDTTNIAMYRTVAANN